MLNILKLEATLDAGLNRSRNNSVDHPLAEHRHAHDRTREDRRVGLCRTLILRGELQLGLRDMHRLLRGPKRKEHDTAGDKQEGHVCRNILGQRPHQHRAVARCLGNAVGIEAGYGDTDEVHQVVTGKGQRQGESTREDRDAQNIDLEELDEPQQERTGNPADKERKEQVITDPKDRGVSRKEVLQPLEEGEIDNRRERSSTPEGTDAAQHGGVAEREDHARDVHHDRTAGKGDDDRKQDGRDDTQGARGIDERTKRRDREVGITRNLEDRDRNSRA